MLTNQKQTNKFTKTNTKIMSTKHEKLYLDEGIITLIKSRLPRGFTERIHEHLRVANIHIHTQTISKMLCGNYPKRGKCIVYESVWNSAVKLAEEHQAKKARQKREQEENAKRYLKSIK